MITIGFSLLDMKTGIFNTPFFLAHAGQAIRACVDLGQDRNTSVGRHPADFQLCQVGTFDDQTGMFAIGTPVPLGTVASFVPVSVMPGGLFAEQLLAARGDTNGHDPNPPAFGPIGGEGV